MPYFSYILVFFSDLYSNFLAPNHSILPIERRVKHFHFLIVPGKEDNIMYKQ